MSFQAYPSYQDSGVEWLGQVPSHWTVTGLKRAFSIVGGSTPKSDVEDFWDGDIPWITPGDLSKLSTKFISETARMITDSGLAFCAASLSPAGSIVVSTRAPIGSLAVTEVNASTNQGCKTLIQNGGASAIFGFYMLSIATEQLNVRGKGSTFLEISADDLGAFVLPFPPLSEQVAISAFLDRETAKIDALIEEQRRLIALLKEKRQAVIYHAVTKGLHPHAPMKDSAIEWLGDVPAHWEIIALRRLVDSARPITYGIVQPGEPDPEGRFMVRGQDYSRGWVDKENIFRVSDTVEVAYRRARLQLGDVVITIVGAGTGNTAVVPDFISGANITQTTARVAPSTGLLGGDYLATLLASRIGAVQVALFQKGAAQPGLNLEHLAAFRFPVPPRAEQAEIIAHIGPRLGEMEQLTAESERAISLLTERRSALISAAVTGKIDVRESAKVLPFPIDRARARGLVASEIIERSAGQATFGRVKFQKIAFLAEGHVGISELAGCYTREAAGPLDRALIDEMESGAGSIADIAVDQKGGTGTTVSYHLRQQRGEHRQELADWLGPDRTAKLDKLIADFAPLNTKQAEAVATLYGVWGDLLSEGVTPSDYEIISGFLHDWHPEKREKFRASELPEWLGWMRRHDIVPTGFGPKTATGRLFV